MSQVYSKYEALAIAYLTGQATSEEVMEYQRLYESDAGFKEIVDDVEIWLAPLNETVTDQMPSDGLLADIMSVITQDEDRVAVGVQQADPIGSHLAENHTDTNPANDNILGRWKALAMASSLVAILSVGSHFVRPDISSKVPVSDTETFMALLSDSTQPELMAIVYEPKTGKVVARLSNINLPEDGDLQLWLIREGEAAPVSLGLLNKVDEVNRVELLAPLALQSLTDTLAVSLEEKGGSKSEGPEGPVLYTGAVSAL